MTGWLYIFSGCIFILLFGFFMEWFLSGMPMHCHGKVMYKYTTPRRRAFSPFNGEMFTIPAHHNIVIQNKHGQYITMSVCDWEYVNKKYGDDYEYIW